MRLIFLLQEDAMQSKNDLPIQRCIKGEPLEALSDVDLLAVLIGSGVKGKNVMECAFYVIEQFGGMNGIYQAGIRELAHTNGVGFVKAIRIKAALELGRRLIVPKNYEGTLDSPRMVWEFIVGQIACNKQEEFWALILDNKNRLLKKTRVSIGTISEAIVHPREVFRDAIREAASSIIIAHNHPSGMLKPSVNDIEITRRVAQAGAIVGIQLLDHVIVTDNDYLSLRETDEKLFLA
ncbi:MAG TPA: DNA repair protein RadC [Spirochaetota bacterium]|jgi:DNA repair protein RadC|nr:DNA repair protein RadC [Spirochaetota bacterium]